MAVLRDHEVELFGKRFPVYGPIQRQLATTFPGKMVVGDYSREDQVVSSSWVVSSMAGGLGTNYASLPRDEDRYYIGTLDPRFQKSITLAPAIKQIFDVGPADVLIPYNEVVYATVGTTVYQESGGTFIAVGPSLPAPAQGATVFFGSLYIITLTGMVEFNATTSTWHEHPAVQGVDIIGWDNKLFYLSQEGEMYWTVDPHTNVFETDSPWTYAGILPLPPGYGRQMIVFFDASGEQVIHVPTRIGLFAYDFDGAMFHKTSLTHPVTEARGRGVGEWRSEMKYPVGSEVLNFNYNVVQSIGPDKDDGLPEAFKGYFKKIVPGHAYYYGVMEAEGEVVNDEEDYMDVDVSMVNSGTFMSQSQRKGIIFNSPGSAWHITYISEDVGSGMGDACVASSQNNNRLYFSTGNGIFYTDAPVTLHNPLQSTTTEYQESGYIETFWFDAGWVEMPKLALGLDVFTHGCQHPERIRVYMAWDEEDEWEYLGAVTAAREYDAHRVQFNIGQTEGRLFRSVKFRFEMTRGDDPYKTPILRNAVFSFTRQPRKLWGWNMRIRLDEDYDGRTPTDMYHELMELANSPNAGEFIYKDDRGFEYRNRVLISNVSSAEPTGTEDYSQFELSVIQMDLQPYG